MAKREKIISTRRALSNIIFALGLLFKSCPGKVIYLLLSVIVASIVNLFGVYFLRYAVNVAEQGGDFYSVVPWLIAFAAVYFLHSVLSEVSEAYLSPGYEAKMNGKLKKRMLMNAAKCDLECYENPEFYDKYTRAMAEGASRCDAVFGDVRSLICSLISFFGFGWIILTSDPIIIFFVIAPLILAALETKGRDRSYEMNMIASRLGRRKDYANRVFYSNEYAKEIHATKVYVPIMKRFEKAIRDTVEMYHKYGTRVVIYQCFADIFDFIMGTYAVYIYLGWRTLVRHSMLLGDAFVSVTAIRNVTGAIYGLSGKWATFHEHALYIENMRFLMDAEARKSENVTYPSATYGDISLEHVSFSYFGSDKKVLQDISLTIKRGEKLAIVGHNGAGKTTLTKLLLRLYDPTEGKITMNGKDIRFLETSSYRDLFSTVLQDHHQFAMSVKANVLLRREKDGDDELVAQALQKSGAASFVSSYPNGMDSILTKEFTDDGIIPSGGQSQMISIAHAHLKNAPVMILDEPSSALDPIAEYEMYRKMMEACKDKTVIFISHRMSSAVLSDRIAYIENGRIIELGSHAELMKLDGKYAEMFRLQSQSYTEEAEVS